MSVQELTTTQTPLLSAAFFIGQFCKDYNDDFMLCKRDNTDPRACALEGRKVTRCAADLYVFRTSILMLTYYTTILLLILPYLFLTTCYTNIAV